VRKLFDFHGGIHPPDNKQQSVRTPIVDAGIPPELVLPLSQHIGAAARAVVTPGQRVLKGQMIAEGRGYVSVHLHAPTSGNIIAIEERLVAHPSGHLAPCIVIATDGLDEWIQHRGTPDYQCLDKVALIHLIRNAGIAGMGGAGFPSAVKLAIEPDTAIRTLIINGTECEPYMTADDMLMRERAGHIIEGIKVLQHIIAPRETLVGVEDNKPEALTALRHAAQDSGIEIVAIPSRYPSGGEKQLIELLTGKQVPTGGLPSQLGVSCHNVGSTAAIYEAVVNGRPLLSRIITVTGNSVREPQNFQVLLGTPIRYLLEQAGYDATRSNRLIMGGSMMGFTVPGIDVPVVKTTTCILAPTELELPMPPPAQACIRCGMCAEVCPASLLPQQLFWFAQGKEFDKLEHHNLFDCIECGACSYVCPSKIPLVQYYRASKADILQMRRTHDKAEAARIRFESRQQRLAQADAEKEARRAARKLAAEQRAQSAATGTADDPIQAAVERARAKKAAKQAGGSAQDELANLEKAVVSAHRRLQMASAKLAEAQGQHSDLVDALQAGVEKTRSRLDAAEQALCDFQLSQGGPLQDHVPADPAQAAIAKAIAARATEAALSPQEKAQADLLKLQQRLLKTQKSLAQSRQHGDEEKVIVALEATVVRLTEKISIAEQQLAAARDV
jgi:electron transport complex protein RnfC